MYREAIGVVETLFYTTALELVDVMGKTANVKLLAMEKDLGGRLVTVIVGGSVSDVTLAIEAARRTTESKPGRPLKMSVVIPRPHEEILKFIVPAEASGEPPDVPKPVKSRRRRAAKSDKEG